MSSSASSASSAPAAWTSPGGKSAALGDGTDGLQVAAAAGGDDREPGGHGLDDREPVGLVRPRAREQDPAVAMSPATSPAWPRNRVERRDPRAAACRSSWRRSEPPPAMTSASPARPAPRRRRPSGRRRSASPTRAAGPGARPGCGSPRPRRPVADSRVDDGAGPVDVARGILADRDLGRQPVSRSGRTTGATTAEPPAAPPVGEVPGRDHRPPASRREDAGELGGGHVDVHEVRTTRMSVPGCRPPR